MNNINPASRKILLGGVATMALSTFIYFNWKNYRKYITEKAAVASAAVASCALSPSEFTPFKVCVSIV